MKYDRDSVRADIVTLLVSRDASSNGASLIAVAAQGAGFPDNAYNAVACNSSTSYIYSLAHEIGHNFGCLHEPRNNGAFGGDGQGALRTLPTWPSGTPRFPC